MGLDSVEEAKAKLEKAQKELKRAKEQLARAKAQPLYKQVYSEKIRLSSGKIGNNLECMVDLCEIKVERAKENLAQAKKRK